MSSLFRSAVLLLGALFATGAFAQPGPDDDGVDPPSRVARLSFIRGAVSFVPAGENDWVEAQLNRPLITGDKLWSDHGSRAELEIGSAVMRIDEETSFDFLNLDDDIAQVELTQGALNLRVRRLYDNQTYEIDTPTLAFVVNRVGEYRVTIAPDGQSTSIAILRGAGDAYGEDGARFRIEEGQFVTFNDSQLRDYYTDSLPRPDDFDDFIAQRDERWDRARSRQYVSEDVIGYEDLDDNGDWEEVADYGHVWYPTTVAVGWTPYHYGHWGWVGAYGWTWIDDAPWGFAPFHYGRWANIRGRWGWCPGPIAVRPYYAPALVAFIGGGVTVSVGGPVGWFPLGPRDVWFPGYRVSRGYFTRVNVSNTIVNTSIINNYYGNYSRGRIDYDAIGYHNRNIAGAVVAVPATAFVNARPVHTAAIAVNRQTFANARVSAFAAVAPTRASLVAANARVMKAPPSAVVDRRIVAATKPPAPIASFAAREAVLQKNPGRPLNVRELRTVPAVQNGARTANANERGAVNQRANVKVVTNAGVPARTPAAPLVKRGNADANAGNARGNGADNNRRAANANDNTRTNPGDNRRTVGGADNARQGNPADSTRREAPGNRDANARENPNARSGNGRGNQPLDSSRFVRGNQGNAEGNGRGQGNANAENPQRRQVTPQQQTPANARQSSGASDDDNARRGGNDVGSRRNNAGGNPRTNAAGNAGIDDERSARGNARSAGGSTAADNAQRQSRSQDESRGNDDGRGNDNARRAQQESQRLEQQQQQRQQQLRQQQQQQQQEQRQQQLRQQQQQQEQQEQQRAQQMQRQQQQQQQQEQRAQQLQRQQQQQQQQQQAQQYQRQQQQRAEQPQYRQPPPQQQQQQRGQQNEERGNRGRDKDKDKDDDKRHGGG
jgi:hypothetical protein